MIRIVDSDPANFQFGQSLYCDQQVVSKEFFSQFPLLLPASADGRHKIFSTLLELKTFYKNIDNYRIKLHPCGAIGKSANDLECCSAPCRGFDVRERNFGGVQQSYG